MTYVIGISGGSGAGKTYFSNKLSQSIGRGKCQIVNQDNYYFDKSGHNNYANINFDHPSAIDFRELESDLDKLKSGISVDIPTYDFTTHSRLKQRVTIFPNKILILEGTLLLTRKKLTNLMDCKIFIDTPSKLRLSRRIARDEKERKRLEDGIRFQWDKQVEPMYIEHIKNSKSEADYIVQGNLYEEEKINEILETIPKNYL